MFIYLYPKSLKQAVKVLSITKLPFEFVYEFRELTKIILYAKDWY